MKKLLYVFLLFAIGFSTKAQSGVLSKKITVNFSNTTIETALKEIETKADVQFSYSSKFIDTNKKVTFKSSSSSIEAILNQMLGEEIEANERGKYIILSKRKVIEKKDFFVMGYVKDLETGEQIADVSIYEPLTLASTLSNSYGYYKIKLPRSQKDIDLRVSKENYQLEVVNIFGRVDDKVDINLEKVLMEKQLTFQTETLAINQIKIDSVPKNLDEYLEMTQVPVPVPDVVPSKKINLPKVELPKVDLSDEFAAIDAGYRKGKDQLMDWLLSHKQFTHKDNIHDSLYRQFQISLLPFIGTNMTLSPFVTNDFSYNIIAGYTGNVRKLEIGGAVNIVRQTMTGVQLSGGLNIVGKQTKGLQAAAGANINFGSAHGFIASGTTNVTFKDGSGLHVAGVINATFGEFTGLQLATYNYATRLEGTQLGVFNFAYEGNGTPIGFFSYVHKTGYRRLEIGASELNTTELSFKTGVKRFYNIFETDFSYGQTDKPLFGFGYGLGTSWSYGKRFSSNLDAVYTAYLTDKQPDFRYDYLSQRMRFSLGLEAKITRRIAVFVAPTLNIYSTNNEIKEFGNYPKLLSERNSTIFGSDSKTYSWLGYKFGLRICNKGV